MPFHMKKTRLLRELFDAATDGDDDLVADAIFRLEHCGVTMQAQNIILMAVNNGEGQFPHARIAHCVARKEFFTTKTDAFHARRRVGTIAELKES